jgi:putative nucleotidyltransferase with HDIG domain
MKTWLRHAHKRNLFRKRAARNAPSRQTNKGLAVNWFRAGLLLFTIAALSLLMSVHLLPDKISLQIGEISPREIRASRSVLYINSVQTENRRQAEARAIRPIYDRDDNAIQTAKRNAQEIFKRLEAERSARPNLSQPGIAAQEAARLHPQFDSTFTLAQLKRLLTISPALFENLQETTLRLISDTMERDIRNLNDNLRPSDDLRYARQALREDARTALRAPEDVALALAVAEQVIRPNLLLNRTRTEASREAARRAVEPVYERITMGERVIGLNETVTQEHLDKFAALGLLNPRLEITSGAAICILAAVMVLLVVVAIARTLPVLYADTRRMALLSLIVLLSVFGLKVGGTMLGLQFSSGQLGYLGMMSVAAAGMLVCVLLDRHLAVWIVALLSALSGLIMNHEIRYTVMTLMSSLVGILCVGGERRKINLPVVTAILAAANVGMVWLLGLLLNETVRELVSGTLWGVGSAAFALFLFWFGILMMERPFGILTHSALLELSAFDRPLLRQLCAVAPGTYAHSMMVGTLAEAGAQAVGADTLLARVGGYYHDIGKMKRPDFFVENQRRDNVHGRLSPSLSALIITAHVRDGLDIAKENRLPNEIRDMIAQHHGTTLIRYFYYQALSDIEAGDETAPPGLEERFRYPGPKPQTREAAIIMLADSIEAAARCLEKPNTERLEALIQNIVRDKIEDGQLDECDLTFQDVRRISDAFLHVLTAMMHGRIDYPEREPRNAIGSPMEVVRADLRPEPPALQLPFETPPGATPEERRALEFGASNNPDSEASRQIAAHLALEQEQISVVAFPRTGNGTPPAEAVTESHYEPSSSETTLPARANDAVASGSEPPAARRRDARRRSKPPAHG